MDEVSRARDKANASDDVDLTLLSSTMIYAEVYNMMNEPEKYKGRKVKIKGQFAVSTDEGQNYFACIISDATACCAQGIEFELDGDYTYPDDYPEIGSEITVEGIFDWYDDLINDYIIRYCRLNNASFE